MTPSLDSNGPLQKSYLCATGLFTSDRSHVQNSKKMFCQQNLLLTKTGGEGVLSVNVNYLLNIFRCCWKQIWCCIVSGNILENKPAQTAAMLSISVFSFRNLEIIDYTASEWPEELRRHSLHIFSSNSRSNKIYAPFFHPKIHHQKLRARMKFLCQNILSSLR